VLQDLLFSSIASIGDSSDYDSDFDWMLNSLLFDQGTFFRYERCRDKWLCATL
jgi:hypothetical protein